MTEADTIEFSAVGDDGGINAIFRVNGKVFATVTGDPTSPEIRGEDGRVLTEIMEPELLSLRPVMEIDTYESGEVPEGEEPIPSPVDEEIREQLRSLGYIE